MGQTKFQSLVISLYELVKNFEKIYPGRPFTPDGHLIGSIGECLVADAYGLELMPPSNKGFDAISKEGKKVEIKATQADRVGFRSCPDYIIIVKILSNGTFEECFNGPGKLIWNTFKGRKQPSNGQYQISISRVKKIYELVDHTQIIPIKNKP